ncbi:MAG: hypothetical protein U0230_16975 [Polyangiales bacterium]
MHRLRTLLATALVSALLFTAVSGCKVTSEDISHWKRTVKGPGKLVAVLTSPHYDAPLRTQAALALVAMDRSDVDGVTELSHAFERMRSANDPQLAAIVTGMVPELERMMAGTENATQQPGQGPAESSVKAKDAAFMLIHYADAATQQKLTQAVVSWYVVDFTGRSLAGNFSVEQVCRQLGAPAASQLVNALSSRMSKEALVKIAELIGQLGDAPTKTRAGQRLVAIEQEMEGDGFITWMKGEIRKQLEAQGQRNVTDARLTTIALANREGFINDGAVPAMKFLGDVDAVRDRLLAIASTPVPANAPDGESLNLRRQRALMALEGHVAAIHVARLLPIALDANNPPNVRDYAFDRIADTRSRDAIASMWPLVQATGLEGDEAAQTLARRLRWRAGELVLAIGGSGVVGEFLTKLPSAPNVSFEPSELEGYATRISQMGDAPMDLLRRELASPAWSRQVLAIHFLARRGAVSDVPAVERLASSTTPCVGQGWARHDPPEETVGKVATAELATMRARLSNPNPAANR